MGLNAAFSSAKSMIQPGMRIDFTGNLQAHHKRVPVQATALMTFRDVRQAVSGFEGEIFKQRGGHHNLLYMDDKTAVEYRKGMFFRIN